MSETKEKVESTAYVGKHLTPAPWNESTAETISDTIEKLTTEGRVISDELIALTVKEEEVTATAVKEHLAPSQLDEGGATDALEVLPVKEEDNLAVADVGETLTPFPLNEREMLDESKILSVKQEMFESSAGVRKQSASAPSCEGISTEGIYLLLIFPHKMELKLTAYEHQPMTQTSLVSQTKFYFHPTFLSHSVETVLTSHRHQLLLNYLLPLLVRLLMHRLLLPHLIETVLNAL